MNRFIMTTGMVATFLALAIVAIAFPQAETKSDTAQPAIVVFYEEGCPDCVRMDEFLEELLTEHPNLTVARYEINAPGTLGLMGGLSAAYGIEGTDVPIVLVGEEAIVGAGRVEEMRLRTAIEDCLTLGCSSPLAHGEKPLIPWGDLVVLIAFFALFLPFFLLQGG
jgi:thiol-disulfide isomerase/thioredoxin